MTDAATPTRRSRRGADAAEGPSPEPDPQGEGVDLSPLDPLLGGGLTPWVNEDTIDALVLSPRELRQGARVIEYTEIGRSVKSETVLSAIAALVRTKRSETWRLGLALGRDRPVVSLRIRARHIPRVIAMLQAAHAHIEANQRGPR